MSRGSIYISLNEEEVKQIVNRSILIRDKDIETFTHNGSSWQFIGLDRVVVTIYDYTLARGRSYIPTPPALASKKAIVNMQNTDNNVLCGVSLQLYIHLMIM